MNLQETRLAESEVAQQQHGLLLRKVASSGKGGLIAPHSGAGETKRADGGDANLATDGDAAAAANPTEFLLVLGALKSDKEVQGVVEIFQRPGGRATVERGYLRFLLQMCDLAGDYLKTRNLRLFADRQLMWTQLEMFTRLVHEGLDPKQTAYTIANEGRRLIGCDRVTVALRYGKQMPRRRGERAGNDRQAVEHRLAVGQVGHGRRRRRRSALVHRRHDQSSAADRKGGRIICRRSAFEARRRAAACPAASRTEENELDRPPPDFLGALIVEQISEDTLTESMRRRVDVVAEHSALALANAASTTICS